MSIGEKVYLASETDRIFNLAAQFWNREEYDEALPLLKEALTIYPINTDVIGLYGDYYEYSDYDLSMQFYEMAIRLNSTRKKDYYQLANFYKWKGEYDKANACYTLWEQTKIRNGLSD